MTDTPPDWVLIEAAKRGNPRIIHPDLREPRLAYALGGTFTALCDMIVKYEQPPVDRRLLCVEQAMYEHGWDNAWKGRVTCCRAIELWKEGFGND
jgi:hypothetical protein